MRCIGSNGGVICRGSNEILMPVSDLNSSPFVGSKENEQESRPIGYAIGFARFQRSHQSIRGRGLHVLSPLDTRDIVQRFGAPSKPIPRSMQAVNKIM